MDDQEYIAGLEKAIREKYGEETIKNPKSNWNNLKEKEYLQELKILQKKVEKNCPNENKIQTKDFFVSEKLLKKDSERMCPVCNSYSFSIKDDLYVNKFQCCWRCFIQWVDGREERWKNGWRPGKIS